MFDAKVHCFRCVQQALNYLFLKTGIFTGVLFL